MSGAAHIYRPGAVTPEIVALTAPPDRAFIDAAVGGQPERIIGFEYLYFDSVFHPCVAFRNRGARGEGQPLNTFIDNLWRRAVNARRGVKLSFLFGPVLVITGDDRFLRDCVEGFSP